MKKLYCLFCLVLVLCGCSKIKEYDGIKVDKIIYQTTDYMGGYTQNYVLDFVNNKYLKNDYLPDEEIPQLKESNEFSDEEEKIFIDACFSYGLFSLAPRYTTNEVIYDGGGWSLTIYYEDGSSKISTGSNAGPVRTFNKLATYFYDICGEEVVGRIPEYYTMGPNISYSYRYTTGIGSGSTNYFCSVKRANYKWNKFSVSDADIYDLNEKIDSLFLKGFNYELILYTANYHYNKKFNRIIVKSYDYNSKLSNEEIVYDGKWFNQIKINLELDKIYVYTLMYKDGNFSDFTFNTRCKNDKINYGEYSYNVFNIGNAKLFINEDNTFSFESFYYYDSKNEVSSLTGNYIIDGNSIILDMNDGVIVLDIFPLDLVVNNDLTTFDLSNYLYINDSVRYSFRS